MYQYYKKERDSLHFNTFKEKERLALPSKFLYVELDQKKKLLRPYMHMICHILVNVQLVYT